METKTATIDDISQFVSWEMGAMSVSNEGENFILQDTKGPLTLVLEPTTNGVYQEISEDHDMIGQGARFVAEKIGDVTTLTAYNDKMVLFTLLSCDDLKEYRNKAYRRLLTSRFEPTEDGLITITDEVMKGPILPESPDLTYFFIEDGEGDLTDKIRLSPGRFHLAFSPADKGVNLHFCAINPETGDLDVLYERENSIILRYAKDPEWPWLSTDVLDAGFLIYNFDKPYWIKYGSTKCQKGQKHHNHNAFALSGFLVCRKLELFENQLCEVVEAIFPNNEVVLSFRIVNECARNAILIAKCLELNAVAHQTISSTAHHPK